MSSSCPSCGAQVSPKAFDCPHCGHPLRKLRRGFFGQLAKWALILFNLAMLWWVFAYLADVGGIIDSATSEAERGGATIGATLGVGFLLVVWVLGDVILGLAALLTRPSK